MSPERHATPSAVERVVILGRGGAGKATAALGLGRLTGLPMIELDSGTWRSDLTPLSAGERSRLRHALAAGDCWVIGGDLGPYGALAPRLVRADTVVVLDSSLDIVRGAPHALRTPHELRGSLAEVAEFVSRPQAHERSGRDRRARVRAARRRRRAR